MLFSIVCVCRVDGDTVTDSDDNPVTDIEVNADDTDPNSCHINVNYLTTEQLGKWRCDIVSTGLAVNTQVRAFIT